MSCEMQRAVLIIAEEFRQEVAAIFLIRPRDVMTIEVVEVESPAESGTGRQGSQEHGTYRPFSRVREDPNWRTFGPVAAASLLPPDFPSSLLNAKNRPTLLKKSKIGDHRKVGQIAI